MYQSYSAIFTALFGQVAIFIALVVLLIMAWNLWLTYINTLFLNSIKWVLLEVRPPKEVHKSPLAMELVLGALYQTGGVGTWYDRYWKGNLRYFFSLEIVSHEGKVRFLVRTPDRFRKLIESQIYSQYPQAEVFEVEDYTKKIPDYKKGGPIELWGCRFELTKDDPYPIKTYVDYGLDKAVGSLDENQRIDPITPTLEFMGSLGAGEYFWFQILVQPDTKRFSVKNKEGKEESGKDWKDKGREVIKELKGKLLEKDAEGKVMPGTSSQGQKLVIEAIERSINKLGFDCGIRALYLAEKASFNAGARIPSLTGILRQFNSSDLNGFKPAETTSFDFPWQDPFGTRLETKKKYLLSDYKNRSYFYGGFSFDDVKKYFTSPGKSGKKPFILTSEELATLFHLPGTVLETPSFERIEATKGEPPANLPI
ncbi:MAG TPA: hypothetical protein VLB02_01345 [Candidatus Paceibacterota bacterium]|nr:hypothetical protein [Candidatus Paceibacterota bacterium]